MTSNLLNVSVTREDKKPSCR